MAEPLVFSNGELFVGLDDRSQVKDLYFPYIGSEQHIGNSRHKIGVWADDAISWIDEDAWEHKSKHSNGLAADHIVIKNDKIGIILEIEDLVAQTKNVFIRNIHIINLRSEERIIKLFTHQAFAISGTNTLDTVQYLPGEKAVLHYSGKRAFVIGGVNDMQDSFNHHSLGLYGNGLDGTWRDAEDGELTNGRADQGLTDSIMMFEFTIGALSSRRATYWLVAAKSIDTAVSTHVGLKKGGTMNLVADTITSRSDWLAPSLKVAEQLSSKYRQPFMQSLSHIKNRIDLNGAIITDFSDGTEGYCSPGEAAYAIWPLARLGYKDEALKFFDFCKDNLSAEGFLYPGYRADGAVRGSRRPYLDNTPPIRSDQTALVVFVFAQVFALSKQLKVLNSYYSELIIPMADFLCDFTENGLPKINYSIKGDNLETSIYTAALTHSALISAVDLASKLKDQQNTVKWRTAADEMHKKLLDLIDGRSLLPSSTTNTRPSVAAFYGAFMFGLIDIDSQIMHNTLKYLEDNLQIKNKLFRSQGDSDEVDYIGSIWMAQYYMEVGRKDEANEILSQVIFDFSANKISKHQVTWSHAEYISAMLDTLTRH